jgi:hypothetical protein
METSVNSWAATLVRLLSIVVALLRAACLPTTWFPRPCRRHNAGARPSSAASGAAGVNSSADGVNPSEAATSHAFAVETR